MESGLDIFIIYKIKKFNLINKHISDIYHIFYIRYNTLFNNNKDNKFVF